MLGTRCKVAGSEMGGGGWGEGGQGRCSGLGRHFTATPKGSYTLVVYHDWLQTSQKVISMRTRELKQPQEWKGKSKNPGRYFEAKKHLRNFGNYQLFKEHLDFHQNP